MLPLDLTIRRRSPGVYGVYRTVKPTSDGPVIVGVLLGVHELHVGDVQRVSPTRWRARSSRRDSDWSGPVFGNRDAAATSLLVREARGPGEEPS